MGVDYQVSKASWDVSRGIRQFQKAEKDLGKGYTNDAGDHLKKGLRLLGDALGHMEKAAEDAYNKAGDEIAKGNREMQKSIDEYASGNENSGWRHYNDAMDCYDRALDIID